MAPGRVSVGVWADVVPWWTGVVPWWGVAVGREGVREEGSEGSAAFKR